MAYLQGIVALSVLLGTAYGVQYLAKIYQKNRYSTELQIVDRLGIEAGVTLLIVAVRGSEFLVSVGGKNVQLLQSLGPSAAEKRL